MKTLVMPFKSIKSKAILILTIMVAVPLILDAVAMSYYEGVVEQHVNDDYFAHAKTLSALIGNYMDASGLYLETQAERLSVISSLSPAALNDTLKNIQNAGRFSNVYVTDTSGRVISSYPYTGLVGAEEMSKPYVSEPIKNGKTYVGEPAPGEDTKNPIIYVGVPIQSESGESLGTLVGALDFRGYSAFTGEWAANAGQYTYLIDGEGRVMAGHEGKGAGIMEDISGYPGAPEVMRGEEGAFVKYNPLAGQTQLIAFSPIKNYGLGVLTAIPTGVAYHPMQDLTSMAIAFLLTLIPVTFVAATFVGRYLVKPIIDMAKAAGEMPSGDYRRYLPAGRQDEIGDLARSFDNMAKTILEDQQNLVQARDEAEAEKERAEFYIDLMGHDINNLNQTVLLGLELIKDDANLTAQQREMIEKAIMAASGSAGIVRNVDSVQRISSEKGPPALIDLNALIAQCIEEAPRPAGKKVEVRYTPREMLIKGTPLAKEIFCNLINNSIKYSGEEVEVDVSTDEMISDGKKYYRISVADTGYGIPDDLKARLFRRFQRGMLKAEGKGLGLYIVKTLAERLGGTVRVEDRVPGDASKGAKFIVLLPAAPRD